MCVSRGRTIVRAGLFFSGHLMVPSRRAATHANGGSGDATQGCINHGANHSARRGSLFQGNWLAGGGDATTHANEKTGKAHHWCARVGAYTSATTEPSSRAPSKPHSGGRKLQKQTTKQTTKQTAEATPQAATTAPPPVVGKSDQGLLLFTQRSKGKERRTITPTTLAVSTHPRRCARTRMSPRGKEDSSERRNHLFTET